LRVESGGNARGIQIGALFRRGGLYMTDADAKKYLPISLSHTLSVSHYASGGGGGENDYRCSLIAIDGDRPFRTPATTTKPVVLGPQTAIVVGKAGEEIWTDEYGRVMVQFQWDREGKKDEKSSCWVRVAQAWAGPKWGAIHIPRIGQEVIVDFLEGDPDRPIITGRVYNGDNMPPYDLPENKTQSGIKSRSTKGGSPNNFNELRFEDKKGSEEVYFQAEKDFDVLVKNDETREIGHDRSEHVKNDETITIDGNRTETVHKDEVITIDGNRTESVHKDETIAIDGARTETVGKDESVSITGLRTLSVGKDESSDIGGKQSITIAKDQSVDVAGARILTIGKDDTISVSGKVSISISKDETLQIGKKLVIDVADEITIVTGDASISMKKNGDITLKGKNITVDGSGKINVLADGTAMVKGSKVSHN
jgi:type VI secretion system secreted protein VgrG